MSRLKFTLKAWPVVSIATIGLCYLTQIVAKWFGVELPDQQHIETIKNLARHCFESWKYFLNFAIVIGTVVVVMPVFEELFFRGLIWRLPSHFLCGKDEETRRARAWVSIGFMALSAALFSAAHYISQPWPDAAFVALFFFGVAQCWLYNKTERIWCAMLNHSLFNILNLVLLFILPE